MKIKGIPFWEQHIEKFILAGFGVVLLGVGAMQLLLRPTDVPLANKPAGPDEIERALKAKAEAVAAKLAADATSSRLVEGELPLAMKTFPDALSGSVSPRSTLPLLGPSLAAAILPREAAVDAGRYYEPKLAAPRIVAVRQESDTLADNVLAEAPDLANVFHFDAGAPQDVTWLVPVAEVDLSAVWKELKHSVTDAKPPAMAIPGLWYKDGLWIIDVVFERAELQANGSWSSPVVVSQLPSMFQFSFRPEVAKAGVDLRDEVFRLLSQPDKVAAVLQPAFLPTKGETFSAGLVLSSLSDVGEEKRVTGNDPEARKISRLKQSYEKQVIERDRLAAEVKELGGPCEPTKEEREKDKKKDDEGGSRGSGGGAGGGLGGAVAGKNNQSQANKENHEKCVRLSKRLKALEAEVAKIAEEIKALSPTTQITAKKGDIDLVKDPKVYVWAHDIWVKPGATYRYTCRIETYNPFFARRRQLLPEQQNLSDAFVLGSKSSSPSAAVTVDPPVAVFVTDAQSNGGSLGLGQARIELYRFFDGARRSETVQVQPGDRIGRIADRRRDNAGSVDFTTDWYVVDILENQGDEGGAKVLLRRSGDDEIVMRSPPDDLSSIERARFEDEVSSARSAATTKEAEKGSAAKPPEGGGGGGARAPGAS